jgi:N6-adenosine-specific RNA methylase IME4
VTLSVNLTATEQGRLDACEQVIERGLATFVDVGMALLEVRDNRLYRAEFPTFEAYCADRWNMSRKRAYDLTGAAEVMQALSPMGDILLPANERQARELSGLSPDVQREVWAAAVETAPEGRVTAAHVRETAVAWLAPDAGEAETREARLERRALALEDRREALQDVPAGQYRVIYADPPWRYEHVETENRAIENHYPTLELAEICALPVSALAADDALLFLWATSPKLAEAMQVIEAWGFNYRTCMVWVKDVIGMGYYARQRHELLLIAVKGHPPVPATAARPDSVQEWPRGRHSEKPHLFYDLIERMYPNWARLELFARNTRAGWACLGNEIDGMDIRRVMGAHYAAASTEQ